MSTTYNSGLRLQAHELVEARRVRDLLREIANPMASFLYDRYIGPAIDDLDTEITAFEQAHNCYGVHNFVAADGHGGDQPEDGPAYCTECGEPRIDPLKYDDETAHSYDVTIKTFVDISPSRPLPETDLKAVLLDNAMDYINLVRESDGDERIAEGASSVEITYDFVEQHTI